MMYEGKNVHYSPVDNKPLCSYSVKVCKQRRLNGYAFCLRHVLEDPSSPFKQCIHIGKNKHQCNNPVPQSKDADYCSSHLNMFNNAALKAAALEGNGPPVTGKGASKNAKTSSTQAASCVDSSALADIKMSLQDRLKSKFNLHKCYKDSKQQQQSRTASASTPKAGEEDPYAFPDGDPEPPTSQNPPAVTSQSINDTVSAIVANCLNNHNLSNNSSIGHATTSAVVSNTSSVIYSNSSGSVVASSSDTTSATVQSTPIAKLYPELAEKLHLPVLSERKVSPIATSGSLSPGSASKSTPPRNTKSARTINKLQTKIAQNRIKDKLKRSQSVSSSSNQSSPDRKAAPVSPVVTMTASLLNWPSVSSIPAVSATAPISTSSPTSTTSSPSLSTSCHLQSLISQLPPLDQPLWSVQQQLQHGIQPVSDRTSTGQSVTPASSVPLLSIAPTYSNATVTASSTHMTPLTAAMTTASPNMTALQQLTHLATHHSPLPTTSSSSLSSSNYSPLLTVPTTSPYCSSSHPPPPPYPGSPPRILEQSLPTSQTQPQPPQPAKPKPPRKTKKEPKKVTKRETKAGQQAKTEPVASSSFPAAVSPLPGSSKTPLPVPKSSSMCVKMQKAKGILTEKGARQKLKRHSAVRVYAYHANLTTSTSHLIPMGVDSSDSEEEGLAPYQHNWLSSSSEDEDIHDRNRGEDEEDESGNDDDLSMMRITKLSLLRAKKRRQYMQIRRVDQVNASCHMYQQRALQALVDATRQSETAAERAVKYIHNKRKAEKEELRVESARKRPCLYQGEDSKKCASDAMPYTNHCHKHIMYNVDQQLFDYCTAKFSDNTQCCVPVFDIKHELPLCIEHGQKADNYQKSQEQGKPKKPRKKTKPSALTRPPKKGKKRKNQKKSKNLKPEDVTSQSDAMETENEGDGGSLGKGKTMEEEVAAPAAPSPLAEPAAPVVHMVEEDDDEEEEAEEEEEEEEKEPPLADFTKSLDQQFSPSNIDKCLELPALDMDEAAKFLDKHDLSDVLKEPFSDLFNTGNSSATPTPPLTRPSEDRPTVAEPPLAAPPPQYLLGSSREESDMIDQALADVAQGVAFPGDKEEDDDDELTKQIIANTLLHQSPPASDDDDDEASEQDNLSKLASSLTPHEIKSISQVINSALQDPNQTIGGLLEYDTGGQAVTPMTTTTNSNSMLLGYENAVIVTTGGMMGGGGGGGGFQVTSTMANVAPTLEFESQPPQQQQSASSVSGMMLSYDSGSGLNPPAAVSAADLATVSVSATTNGSSLPSIGIEDYINQAGLQLLGSNNQQALYNGHLMEPVPNPGSNIQSSATIQAPSVSLQASQQGNHIQALSSFPGATIQVHQQPGISNIQAPGINSIHATASHGLTFASPGQHQQQQQQIQAPLIHQQLPGARIQAPQQHAVTNIQAPNIQQLQQAQHQANSFPQQPQPLNFLSTGNSSLALSNNSSSNTLAALAQQRTLSTASSSSSSSSISSLAAALASAQQPSTPSTPSPATNNTHIRHLLAAAAAKPPIAVPSSGNSLSQLLGGSSTEASISQLAALFSSQQQQQQGGRSTTGGGNNSNSSNNITLAVALASQAPHLSHSLVTAAAAAQHHHHHHHTPQPQHQQQPQVSEGSGAAAASANAQISAIAAALANNHPVPPINSTMVQSDSSGPANGLLKPHTTTHTSSFHLS